MKIDIAYEPSEQYSSVVIRLMLYLIALARLLKVNVHHDDLFSGLTTANVVPAAKSCFALNIYNFNH
jgi:hypothetical protein